MKKLYYLIVVVLISSLVLTGCLLSNVGQVPTNEQSGIAYLTKATEGDPFVTPLLAGQTIDVGTVSVWNDDTNLYVTYNTTGGWVMTETHLAVVTDPGDFPTNKAGNPKVGHFPYSKENIFMTTWEQTIEFAELEGWTAGGPLYIAAHAAIEEVTCFDGTPPGVTVEDTEDLYIGGSITVEALVKVEISSTNTDKYTIVGKWNDRDGDDRAWLLGVFNLYPCFYISDDGEVFPKAISGDKLIPGQWYHLKGTFDSVTGEIKIYVDNVLRNTNNTDLVNIYLNDEPVLIGGDRAGGGGGAFFNGCIYEVKVWDDVIEGDAVLVLEWPETPVTESAWADGDYRFTEQGNWGMYFKYVTVEPYSFTDTQPVSDGTVGDLVTTVAEDGDWMVWTFDFPVEVFTGNGNLNVGLIIATDGEGNGPAFQIHNNDGADSGFAVGTWLYSEWGPTITDGWMGWHSGTGGNNELVSGKAWIEAIGQRNTPWEGLVSGDGVMEIRIKKSELGESFYWAASPTVGSGFFAPAYDVTMQIPAGFGWGTPLVNMSVPNYVAR